MVRTRSRVQIPVTAPKQKRIRYRVLFCFGAVTKRQHLTATVKKKKRSDFLRSNQASASNSSKNKKPTVGRFLFYPRPKGLVWHLAEGEYGIPTLLGMASRESVYYVTFGLDSIRLHNQFHAQLRCDSMPPMADTMRNFVSSHQACTPISRRHKTHKALQTCYQNSKLLARNAWKQKAG